MPCVHQSFSSRYLISWWLVGHCRTSRISQCLKLWNQQITGSRGLWEQQPFMHEKHDVQDRPAGNEIMDLFNPWLARLPSFFKLQNLDRWLLLLLSLMAALQNWHSWKSRQLYPFIIPLFLAFFLFLSLTQEAPQFPVILFWRVCYSWRYEVRKLLGFVSLRPQKQLSSSQQDIDTKFRIQRRLNHPDTGYWSNRRIGDAEALQSWLGSEKVEPTITKPKQRQVHYYPQKKKDTYITPQGSH